MIIGCKTNEQATYAKNFISQRVVMLKGSKQLVLAQNGFKPAVAMKGMHADIRETQLLLQTN